MLSGGCYILNIEADQILRSLFRNIGLAMVTLEAVENGENYRILDLNQEVEKIEKIKKEDIVGKLITEVFPSVDKFGLLEALAKTYRTGDVTHLPTEYYEDERIQGYRENNIMKLPSGHLLVVYTDKTKEIELKSSLIKSEKKYRSLIENSLVATTVTLNEKRNCSSKDNTDNKPEKLVDISNYSTEIEDIDEKLRTQIALLKEIDEMKNIFITTATHELRTSASSILGYIDYVLENDKNSISKHVIKDLNVIQRNAQRLVNLTNDLLDVQRLTTGRFEIVKTEFDFVSMLNEVLEELIPTFDAKKQVLRVNTPTKVVLHADKVRISQVLINLIHNANKFAPEGGVVSLTVEPKEMTVNCTVVDNGIGINEIDLNKLFEPFPSIRHGNNVRSTGLGLAISKGILELHGGKIWAESIGQGKGSTFHISIPYFDD